MNQGNRYPVLIVFVTLWFSGCDFEPASEGVPEREAEQASEIRHGYADNDGVNIHYAEIGEGPLVVMIHGFPDFWYSWRHQMAGLKDGYRVVASDQRGYNL
jgi:alpha-beta hydrolase superfamily lysophospholipase